MKLINFFSINDYFTDQMHIKISKHDIALENNKLTDNVPICSPLCLSYFLQQSAGTFHLLN
jgi:hypothetical protein